MGISVQNAEAGACAPETAIGCRPIIARIAVGRYRELMYQNRYKSRWAVRIRRRERRGLWIDGGNMADIEYYSGDLILDSKVDVICHQVNCQAVMGSGIAKQIHILFPRVFDKYTDFCKSNRMAGQSPLGKCQLVWTDETKTRIVANLFGQERYGRHKRQTDYDALRKAVSALAHNQYLLERKASLGFPYRIGCALGGGDWGIVSLILEKELKEYPGRVEIWKLERGEDSG